MGLRTALARAGAHAPVPVFAVAGAGAREAVQDLLLAPEVELLDAPRPANVLLLAGEIPPGLLPAAVVAHDSMSAPRRTVWWRRGANGHLIGREFPHAIVVEEGEVVPILRRVHLQVLDGSLPSEPPLLPDVEPASWRGVGPYGQGGSGMTGGVPYGRPMPERAEDRDGLMLDQLAVRVGPLVPALPAGLTLDLRLQGDVVQDLSVQADRVGRVDVAPSLLRPFLRALDEPVPIAELELARARSHLRWAAWALRIHGLAALSERTLRLARRVEPADASAVGSLARSLRRTGLFGWATAGVGAIPSERLAGSGLGPVARASGVGEDVRLQVPAYRALGFEVLVREEGDAAARWRQRLAEAAQALDLSARAGDHVIDPGSAVEGPHGAVTPGDAPADRLLPLLPEVLSGLEWGDAVTTLASLDLDLEEAAAAVRVRAGATT